MVGWLCLWARAYVILRSGDIHIRRVTEHRFPLRRGRTWKTTKKNANSKLSQPSPTGSPRTNACFFFAADSVRTLPCLRICASSCRVLDGINAVEFNTCWDWHSATKGEGVVRPIQHLFSRPSPCDHVILGKAVGEPRLGQLARAATGRTDGRNEEPKQREQTQLQ